MMTHPVARIFIFGVNLAR